MENLTEKNIELINLINGKTTEKMVEIINSINNKEKHNKMENVKIELTEKELKFLMLSFVKGTKDLKNDSKEAVIADKIYNKLNVNKSLNYLVK